MKIFGKRKRKVDVNETSAGIFKSDPVVEELLTKDPSSWNSKQRRMVKRYQERKAGEGVVEEKAQEDSKKELPHMDENDDGSSLDGSSTSGHSSASNASATEHDPELEEEDPEKMNVDSVKEEDETDAQIDEKVLQDLMNKLNAKQRRTLSRKLERGSATPQEVLRETKSLLGIKESARNETAKPPAKKGRRRNKVDWDTLPPEERLRREKQRRKQKEAAERRKHGEDASSQFKHPLNSERRRANRRKPKYARKLVAKKGTIAKLKHQ